MAKLGDEFGHLGPNVGVADLVAVPEIGGEAADGGGATPLAEDAVDVPRVLEEGLLLYCSKLKINSLMLRLRESVILAQYSPNILDKLSLQSA